MRLVSVNPPPLLEMLDILDGVDVAANRRRDPYGAKDGHLVARVRVQQLGDRSPIHQEVPFRCRRLDGCRQIAVERARGAATSFVVNPLGACAIGMSPHATARQAGAILDHGRTMAHRVTFGCPASRLQGVQR